MIQARCVAETDGVRRRQQPEGRVRTQNPVLVQQRHFAVAFQHALNDEHDIRAAGIVFVEHQGNRILQRPGQDAVAEFRDLFAVLDDDGVLADQVDTADMAVQVDADARPVQPRGDLFDMGRFARAVISLDQEPAVMGKRNQDRESRVVVETIGIVEIRHMLGFLRVGRNLHIDIESEHVAHGHRGVRQVDLTKFRDKVFGLGSHSTPFLQHKRKKNEPRYVRRSLSRNVV